MTVLLPVGYAEGGGAAILPGRGGIDDIGA